jgi:hypothetical protein
LKLTHDEPLSNVAFNLKLRHYSAVALLAAFEEVFGVELVDRGGVPPV